MDTSVEGSIIEDGGSVEVSDPCQPISRPDKIEEALGLLRTPNAACDKHKAYVYVVYD